MRDSGFCIDRNSKVKKNKTKFLFNNLFASCLHFKENQTAFKHIISSIFSKRFMSKMFFN